MKGRMIYSEEYSSCSKDMQSEVHCALRGRNKGINKHSAESTTAGLEFHIEFGKWVARVFRNVSSNSSDYGV